MVEPISTAIALKFAAGIAGKLAVKAYFAGKMVGLKTFLANYVGSTTANVSVGLLATAATAAFWEKNVKRNSDEDAIAAAVAKGVSRDVAHGIVHWLNAHA